MRNDSKLFKLSFVLHFAVGNCGNPLNFDATDSPRRFYGGLSAGQGNQVNMTLQSTAVFSGEPRTDAGALRNSKNGERGRN